MLGLIHRTAAHDFNDSLNSLTLNLELLARAVEGDVPPEKKADIQQRCIGAIRQEIKRMSRSTGRALEASGHEVPAGRVAVATVVEEVISGLRPRSQRQQVSVNFDAPQQLIEVRGRTDELRLAIFNLMLNALEAMPAGGELNVHLSTDQGMVVLGISDNGPGIAHDLQAKVWDLFHTTKPEALGIGLPVVKNIVVAYGGTVTFDSRESGLTVAMRLPRLQ